jgi:hypothetical protein
MSDKAMLGSVDESEGWMMSKTMVISKEDENRPVGSPRRRTRRRCSRVPEKVGKKCQASSSVMTLGIVGSDVDMPGGADSEFDDQMRS